MFNPELIRESVPADQLPFVDQMIKLVRSLSDATSWEDNCLQEWEEAGKEGTFKDYLDAAQTDLDWLVASEGDLEGYISQARKIFLNES